MDFFKTYVNYSSILGGKFEFGLSVTMNQMNGLQCDMELNMVEEMIMNKTGTSKVGAISEAQKAQFFLKLEFFEIFLSENVA